MQHFRYIKSFSKGQVTIPKDIRNALGIGEDFWLKLFVEKGKIIAEPTEQKEDEEEFEKKRVEYRKKLLSIKTTFDLGPELKRNREQIEERLKKYEL
jgi:AbrB family looped-hinge helix DNA binding protein